MVIENHKGFTLVEMMIVIGTIAVITGIASLNYLSMRPGMRLNGAARQVMGDLMDARMNAVNQNNKYRVFFMNDHEYKILDDDDGDGTEDAGEQSKIKNIQSNYPGVTFSATGNPIFSSRGTADSTATITLTNSAGSKNISVNTAGRVKIN